jgi:surfactin synthase thioesterase subunit
VLANSEVLEFFLPVLRADIATAETYQPSSSTALACAVTAIAGNADATTRPTHVAAWQSFTKGEFRFHELEGHHFVIQQQPEAVFAIVREVAERQAAANRYSHLALRNL